MAIYYRCRHCQNNIGMLEDRGWTDRDLGFDRLTQEERNDIILHDNGNTYVYVICDHCQEILDHYPDRILSPYLIQ